MKDLGVIIANGKMKIALMDLMPYRKKPCLCIFKEPNSYVKVASFNDVDAGVIFMQYLADMIGAKREDDETD